MKFNKFTLLIPAILLCTTSTLAQSGKDDEARALIGSVINNYEKLNDYTVDLEASMNMPGVSVPNMKAKIYYKRPNKVSIKSDGFLLLPKRGVIFDPSFFGLDSLDSAKIRSLGDDTTNGKIIKKYSIHPDRSNPDSITIWLEPERKVIRKVERLFGESGRLLIELEYIRVNEFFLPAEVSIRIDIPKALLNFKGSPFGEKNETLVESIEGLEEDSKGFVKVKYSNYVVNHGISDDIFEQSPFIK